MPRRPARSPSRRTPSRNSTQNPPRPHSAHGGRHELGQNFLRSHSAVRTITNLTRATTGPILEIGPGDGSVTKELYRLGRELTLVELDETRLDHLGHTFPRARIRHEDAVVTRFDHPVVVGNLPFHLTTPILRSLLRGESWHSAILLTQWEVARKRAGIGGSTMMTAQWSPWFDFRLVERVPAHAFAPRPSVDGGILTIDRRSPGLLPDRSRSRYQTFVRSVFTGRGRGMKGILQAMSITDRRTLQSTMDRNHVRGDTLPRDLTPQQWAGLFSELADETAATKTTGQKRAQRKTPKTASRKGKTMSHDRGAAKDASAKKPVITGELPITGIGESEERLRAQLPGVDPAQKSHDKGSLQAERGYMPQHQKPKQPQPKWNLPRRQG